MVFQPEDRSELIRAAEQTWIVRFPQQSLATFGSTNLSYYVVTEPIYKEIEPNLREGVVRTGKVIAQKPTIVTPYYAMNLEGFSSEAYEYFQLVSEQRGRNSPGILYQYRNEPANTEIVGGKPSEIADRIDEDLTSKGEKLSVVMVGVDEFWDVALLKFIYEFTSHSASQNVRDFDSRGMLNASPSAGGIPMAAVNRIEQLFDEVRRGRNPEDLRGELDSWGVFELYEDRFLDLFLRRM